MSNPQKSAGMMVYECERFEMNPEILEEDERRS